MRKVLLCSVVPENACTQDAVRNFFISKGALAFKLRIIGRGLKDPIASNETDKGRAKNRRVEVVVMGRMKK